MKVSVIIPVYNAERYIGMCIRSVLNQTYRDLEVIAVDDGSLDGSIQICERFRRMDKRMVILRQENRGVSCARNRGLDAACGEYVFFLDSDDAIHPRLIEELIRRAKRVSAEIVFCTYIKADAKQMEKLTGRVSKYPVNCRWKYAKEAEAKEWFHERYLRELSCIGGKLICRDTIGDERFDEGLSSGEDTVFLYHLIQNPLRMAYLDEEWYYYRRHSGSKKDSDRHMITAEDFKAYRMIRDSECQKGRIVRALEWEYRYVWRLLSAYLKAADGEDEENSRILGTMIAAERKHMLYQALSGRTKLLFYCLYSGCSYVPAFRALWVLKQRIFPV